MGTITNSSLPGTQTPAPDTTGGTVGTATSAAPSDHAHQLNNGLWLPVDHGLLAWTFDPAFAAAGSVYGPAGQLGVYRLRLPAQISVTNILLKITVAGNTLANAFAGLYSSNGTTMTLLGASADQSSLWTSTGIKTMALTGGPFSVGPGAAYVAILVGSATTMPQIGENANAPADMLNIGQSGATLRSALGASSLTALPSPVTLSTLSANGHTKWIGLS